MAIEELLLVYERRRLEAVRLIALARDLLVDEREQMARAGLEHALNELDRLDENRALRPSSLASADDKLGSASA